MSTLSLYEPKYPSIRPPKGDGDINLYINQEAKRSNHFNPRKRIIYINGVGNSPQDHLQSCAALSLLQFCPVIGVYNATGTDGKGNGIVNTLLDVVQCLTDKCTSFEQFRLLPASQRAGLVEDMLGGNRAAVALFRLIRDRKYDIHAHSQGNYIVSNTLSAIKVLDGASALKYRVIHTYGSPCGSWPSGVRLINREFNWDPISNLFQITSIDGVLRSFSGNIIKVKGASHAFLQYMKYDPQFVIKRFEKNDPLGLGNPSLNEKALAAWADKLGNNFRRIDAVFRLAAKRHKFIIANVCHHYMNKYGKNLNDQLNRSSDGKRLRQFLKQYANTYKQKEFGLMP